MAVSRGRERRKRTLSYTAIPAITEVSPLTLWLFQCQPPGLARVEERTQGKGGRMGESGATLGLVSYFLLISQPSPRPLPPDPQAYSLSLSPFPGYSQPSTCWSPHLQPLTLPHLSLARNVLHHFLLTKPNSHPQNCHCFPHTVSLSIHNSLYPTPQIFFLKHLY